MQKDCPCRGTNENCFRCYGRGYYDEDDLQPLATIPFTKLKPIPPTPTIIVVVKCPQCGILVFKEHLLRHINKAHNKLKSLKSGSIPKTAIEIENENKFVRCPYCPNFVKSKNMKRHIEKFHKNLAKKRKEVVQKVSQSQKLLMGKDIQNYSDSDGSKGWQEFRDSGKLGSFPSFDPMDDESKP
jgi:uncharacterized C2H2 Zn-finger protein